MNTLSVILSAVAIELTILFAYVGFRVQLEKRLGGCLTREQHEAICEKREAETRAVLARIETKIDDNEERAATTRHDIRDTVHTMQVELAVLKRASGR